MTLPLRIAWIGGPSAGGGVGGFCRQLLAGLIESGHDVTVLSANTRDDFHSVMGPLADRCDHICHPPAWEWNRWYSRSQMGVFFSSFWARRRAYSHVVRSLLAENRCERFDVVVQFSQTELFELKRHLKALPPVLLFPCVHAAGELHWHRAESRLALRTESRLKHYLVRANLMHRAHLQRKCCQAVHGVIGMSRRFNELNAADYGIKPINQAVVYQPIETENADKRCVGETDDAETASRGRVELLFVGRISVRKGIEMLTDLSHRIADLAGQVRLRVLGGPSFWSDYSSLLADLNPRVAEFIGPKPHSEVVRLMAASDVLLAPSHYEPGGIVVAEALAEGCAIVASDEVGSAEPLSEPACLKFPSGDIEAFESAVRQMVLRVLADGVALRSESRQAASECFRPTRTADDLTAVLRRAAAGQPIGAAHVEAEAVPA